LHIKTAQGSRLFWVVFGKTRSFLIVAMTIEGTILKYLFTEREFVTDG